MTPGSGSLFTELDRKILLEINPELALAVYLAAENASLRLRVIEGLRTRERQAELVRTGASRTLNSRHLTGHAVDIVPLVEGEVRWDWPLFYPIAAAMRRASIKLEIPIRWGGVWDKPLAELPENPDDIQDAQSDYVTRVRAAGKKPFLDGPHFELPA